jgi:hypothetical protein
MSLDSFNNWVSDSQYFMQKFASILSPFYRTYVVELSHLLLKMGSFSGECSPSSLRFLKHLDWHTARFLLRTWGIRRYSRNSKGLSSASHILYACRNSALLPRIPRPYVLFYSVVIVSSSQSVMSSPQKQKQTKIAKNLKLLPYLVSDMAVVGMEPAQRRIKRVDVRKTEDVHAKSTDCV